VAEFGIICVGPSGYTTTELDNSDRVRNEMMWHILHRRINSRQEKNDYRICSIWKKI
jgi:hypothetical protein